jgi:acyl carrier protein
MSEEEILDKIRPIIVEKLGIPSEKITMDASFIKDLDADSLTAFEMIWAIEDAIGIEVPDEKLMDIHTVRDAVQAIAVQMA